MGLTSVGLEQPKNFLGRNTPAAKRTPMADLEPSAARVLASLIQGESDELSAWSDARELGRGLKAKNAGEGLEAGLRDDRGEETGWGLKREDDDDDDDNDEVYLLTPQLFRPACKQRCWPTDCTCRIG